MLKMFSLNTKKSNYNLRQKQKTLPEKKGTYIVFAERCIRYLLPKVINDAREKVWQCMSCVPTAFTVSIVWSFRWHHYSSQHRDACQISGGHHRPGIWYSSCWHGVLTFHASLPHRELRYTSPHQRRQAPKVHQCQTQVKAPPVPDWRAVG